MTWENNLQDAAFRGVQFDCRATDDDVTRDLAAHAYPYRDGASFEDLGRGPRQFSLEVFLWGDDYEFRLRDLLIALDRSDEGDLSHPIWGSLFVRVRAYKVHHDADNRDACTISVQFVEHVADAGFFSHKLTVQKAAEIGPLADAARAASTDAVDKAVKGEKKKSKLAQLRDKMNALSAKLQAKVKGFIQSGLDIIAYPSAWASDIVGIADGFLSLRSWGIGEVRQSFMALTRLADLFGFGRPKFPADASVNSHLSVVYAGLLADGAANVFSVEADAPTMSPAEIEVVSNLARAAIDEAIETARLAYAPADLAAIVEPLRAAALAIQAAARAVIEARPPMIDRVADAPACLRLLAHKWYGDHARAIELQRLNNLAMPNFIARGDVLHAYAN
ncbi:MAG: DNA circularization N-terminal domain-containing protein [Pseudomonadota bacterium]|nr:DNA circularization N-terminal domain-containing protein [Pseudomonadota bacterium]